MPPNEKRLELSEAAPGEVGDRRSEAAEVRAEGSATAQTSAFPSTLGNEEKS